MSSALDDGTEIRIQLIRRPLSALIDDYTVTSAISTTADHGIANGLPIILFTSNNTGDQDVSFTFNNNGGNLAGSTANSHVEGTGTVPSTISILYDNRELLANRLDVITIFMQSVDSQGIARCIANSLLSQPEHYGTANGNNVEISYIYQSLLSNPQVTVILAGSSGLANSDFTVTEIRAGNRPTGTGAINTDIPDHPGDGDPFPAISFDNFYNANDGSNI